jgi:hypothetical protein
MKEFGGVPQGISPLLRSSGAEFETRVEAHLAAAPSSTAPPVAFRRARDLPTTIEYAMRCRT